VKSREESNSVSLSLPQETAMFFSLPRILYSTGYKLTVELEHDICALSPYSRES